MASERMNWDHHADHDLLTAMMQELQPSQEQLRGVMNRMHGFGYTCTVKAITQHLQKLRRKEGGPGPAAGKDDGAGPSTPKSTPKTPGGRKKNVGAAAKSTPGSAKRKKSAATAESVDDSEPDTKKVKDEKTDVKQEIASEE
ncbi:uncharacterized protein B0T15DRAFT_494867 [Chaetomium strumarium]|uniref:Uncharacterized protein n=1 Tax=Chaetomium strumarium TaxID=1170767 RepID=A0AAJ0GQQ7_9PEZI|nr:hypothetical protein B0T15DRAFT_494867 [Chaetomium strumarium]